MLLKDSYTLDAFPLALLLIAHHKIQLRIIWLQAKTWVRRFYALILSFSHLKWMFEWFIRHTTFIFATLQMYGAFSEIKY